MIHHGNGSAVDLYKLYKSVIPKFLGTVKLGCFPYIWHKQTHAVLFSVGQPIDAVLRSKIHMFFLRAYA